ncbi:glycosyltransferase family 2 protein [Alkalicoccus chagannorensis]|uniref:glycosyltransferase family 2 protein n=1 Tax=Alkalicoccus chagannorensis TaxID=427072 RepID=UPI00041DA0B8|nr:glycosyltransferase [Alkalicoccus chagannorensis]
MTLLLIIIFSFFWLLLLFYSILTIAGVYYRLKKRPAPIIESWPSVSILIPAHNEGLVLEDTLKAMQRLTYPGRLEVFVLNDNSTDTTAETAQQFADAFQRMHHIPVPAAVHEPKGKSRVLNYGLRLIDTDYFLVYDADNQPEEHAVTRLMEQALAHPDAAGAVGYVRTANAGQNWLTRMIALEFQVFQLLMQCGRWQLFRIGSLAGTNMLLKKDVLDAAGGYDLYALAEDAELTIRLTSAGWTLPVVPEAVTWEQEPETLKALIKQRTRWLIGNLYLLEKIFRDKAMWKSRSFHHAFQHVSMYFAFAVLLLVSHVCFIISLTGLAAPMFAAPILMFWFMSYMVYTMQLLSTVVLDQNVSPKKVITVAVMYFTYAQLFILLLLRSGGIYLWKRMLLRQTIGWDKTARYKGRSRAV